MAEYVPGTPRRQRRQTPWGLQMDVHLRAFLDTYRGHEAQPSKMMGVLGTDGCRRREAEGRAVRKPELKNLRGNEIAFHSNAQNNICTPLSLSITDKAQTTVRGTDSFCALALCCTIIVRTLRHPGQWISSATSINDAHPSVALTRHRGNPDRRTPEQLTRKQPLSISSSPLT